MSTLRCLVMAGALLAGAIAYAAAPAPPLRSHAMLEAYLESHADRETPLDLLPPMARRRFLGSLVFGRNGLGGFNTGDLATELTRDEAARVLALFDAGAYVQGIHFRHPDTPPSWRGKAATPGMAEAAFDQLYPLQPAPGDDPLALHIRFERLFATMSRDPATLAALPERELVYLLRSLELVSFHAPMPRDITFLQQVVAAMEGRGIAQQRDLQLVRDALLRVRRFEDARRYATEHAHAGLRALPRMEDAPGGAAGTDAMHPGVWRLDPDGTVLTRTTLDLTPTQVLVIAGCHFSQDAAEDISGDPVLGPVFARHAHWLMLPPGHEDQDAVPAWNLRFPQAQATQIYDRSEWPQLPAGWVMPTFLIVRDGKVLERITGWPRNPATNQPALVDALRRHGLLAPAGQ